jgi:hypothetical protein
MALSVRDVLDSKQMTVLVHPLYSLDLASSELFLFPKIREILKEGHYDDIDDIRSNMTAALKAIPQIQFQDGFNPINSYNVTFMSFHNSIDVNVTRCA